MFRKWLLEQEFCEDKINLRAQGDVVNIIIIAYVLFIIIIIIIIITTTIIIDNWKLCTHKEQELSSVF